MYSIVKTDDGWAVAEQVTYATETGREVVPVHLAVASEPKWFFKTEFEAREKLQELGKKAAEKSAKQSNRFLLIKKDCNGRTVLGEFGSIAEASVVLAAKAVAQHDGFR